MLGESCLFSTLSILISWPDLAHCIPLLLQCCPVSLCVTVCRRHELSMTTSDTQMPRIHSIIYSFRVITCCEICCQVHAVSDLTHPGPTAAAALRVSQEEYVRKLLARLGMEHAADTLVGILLAFVPILPFAQLREHLP